MPDLPPMLHRPDLYALERQRAGTSRRATRDRRTEYRQMALRDLAAALDDPEAWYSPEAFGLTETQAAGIRRDIARTLRHRADAHEGRIRI